MQYVVLQALAPMPQLYRFEIRLLHSKEAVARAIFRAHVSMSKKLESRYFIKTVPSPMQIERSAIGCREDKSRRMGHITAPKITMSLAQRFSGRYRQDE